MDGEDGNSGKPMVGARVNGHAPSTFQAKLAGVAEVAVGEAVEERETSDAVEVGRDRRDADDFQVVVECQGRNGNGKAVDGEFAVVGAAELQVVQWAACAKQAIVLLRDQMEARGKRTR